MMMGTLVVTNDTLMGHRVVLDQTGKLVPWLQDPEPFSKLTELAWTYWTGSGVPNMNGHPLWYWYPSWHPGQPRGNDWPATPASMVMWMAAASIAQHAYSGNNSAVHNLAMPLALYAIANGTTPLDAGWVWGGMPYASSDPGAPYFRGANSSRFGGKGVGDGIGVIEPDKAAQAALGFLLLANATSEAQGGPLRSAAIAIGDTLAANVRASPLSDASHSPWPFRVWAKDGTVEEEYTSNVQLALLVLDTLLAQCASLDCTAPLRLRYSRESMPRARAYERAARLALEWQQTYPEANGRWTACCEDVTIDNSRTNDNSVQPLQAAQYLIARRVSGWETRARRILATVEKELIFNQNCSQHASRKICPGPAVQWGARTVAEQLYYPIKMGVHTGRYAATVAMLNDAASGGGNATLADIAYRSFSWALYCTQADGANLVGPQEQDIWFRIQLMAGVLQPIDAMAYAARDRPSADHLLLTLPFGIAAGGTVLTRAAYAKGRVEWSTSGLPSTERLRLTFAPRSVVAGGKALPRHDPSTLQPLGWWSHEEATGLTMVHHTSAKDVVVAA